MTMKKSIVAVGVLVVLGGIWIGISWYTGKIIESHLKQGITQAQAELQKSSRFANTNLTIAKYQRGIFSSQIIYTVEIGINQDPKDYITLNQNVSHGPFPLEKFSFMPKLAYSKTELANTQSVKNLFNIATDKPPIVIDTLSAYDGTSTVKMAIAPLDDKRDKDATNTIKFNGMILEGTIDVAGDKSTFNFATTPIALTKSGTSLKIDKISLEGNLNNVTKAIDSKVSIGDLVTSGIGDNNAQEFYIFKGIELTNKIKTGKFEMSVGLVDFKMKSFVQEINSQPELSISDVTIASNAQEDDKNINQTLDTTIGNLSISGQDIGSGRLMMKFNQFDGSSLKYINDNSNQMTKLLIASTMEEYHDMDLMDEKLTNQLVIFLAANPSISISPFTWKNPKGESQIDMTLTLQNPEALPLNDISQASKLIKQFNSHARLSVPMITEQARVHNVIFDKMAPDQAQLKADKQIKALIDVGAITQSLTLQDDNLVGTFNYADGIIDLNGQKMSVEKFVQRLGSLYGN